jgi:hypothetical protein
MVAGRGWVCIRSIISSISRTVDVVYVTTRILVLLLWGRIRHIDLSGCCGSIQKWQQQKHGCDACHADFFICFGIRSIYVLCRRTVMVLEDCTSNSRGSVGCQWEVWDFTDQSITSRKTTNCTACPSMHALSSNHIYSYIVCSYHRFTFNAVDITLRKFSLPGWIWRTSLIPFVLSSGIFLSTHSTFSPNHHRRSVLCPKCELDE